MGKYVSGILVCDLDWGQQKICVNMMKNRKVVLKPLDFSYLNALFESFKRSPTHVCPDFPAIAKTRVLTIFS